MKPKRIQRKRTKGWLLVNNEVGKRADKVHFGDGIVVVSLKDKPLVIEGALLDCDYPEIGMIELIELHQNENG